MRVTASKHRSATGAHVATNDAAALKVRDIMSSGVLVLTAELTLRDAVELLAERHVTGAPVVASGRVVGVLSANDILAFEADTPGVPTERIDQAEQDGPEPAPDEEWEKEIEAPSAYFNEMWVDAGADVAERFAELQGPEWDVLEEHTVGEAMSRVVRSVRPETPVADAAAYMLKQHIHRAIVLEDGELVGIVTATDVMRAVGERRI